MRIEEGFACLAAAWAVSGLASFLTPNEDSCPSSQNATKLPALRPSKVVLMFLKRMRLQHSGAFRDTGWLEFSSGVNLIVGQNNSGKSSLIKSFERALRDTPHVSLDAYRTEDLKRPFQELELVVTGQEVRRALLRRGGNLFWPLAKSPSGK